MVTGLRRGGGQPVVGDLLLGHRQALEGDLRSRGVHGSELHRPRERDSELHRLTLRVRKFAAMMTTRHGDRIEGWNADAEQDTLAPLASFAHNLRRDLDAVRNGLSLPYGSGAVDATSTG
ncbi:hypothetical protein PUR34_04600 [Streptomyces sp. JV185]|uniref:hypothetical protein n=1 Tax=Streptomyces sp. JV185 TaxID=858638 RepID=UPI002E779041|nr:hypothetical protein [Streptomyces sp. JV185]MEE1767477.1 hypothetical protein [Streptomyces sp. JV185]